MKNRFYDLIEIIAHLLQAINKKVPTNLGLQQNCSVLLKMSYCIQPYLSSCNNELSITFMFQQQSKLISGFPENKAETSQKQHSCEPIKYLCLQPCCQLSRLACRQCASQCHLRHKVAIIDKLIQPLNRLSMNSYQARAQDDYNTLYSKMSEICVEWEKMQNIIIKNMLQLQDGIIFQLSTVINTFSCQEGDKAEEAMTNPATPPQLINQYVAKIHFLNKGYLSDSQTVINYADFIIARTNSTIARTTKKIDIILTKMQNRIREIDFTNIDAKAEVVQGNVALRNIAAEGELGQPKLEAFSDSEQETEKKARVREDGQAKERRRAREGRHNKQQQSVTTRFGSGSVPRKAASSKQKINK